MLVASGESNNKSDTSAWTRTKQQGPHREHRTNGAQLSKPQTKEVKDLPNIKFSLPPDKYPSTNIPFGFEMFAGRFAVLLDGGRDISIRATNNNRWHDSLTMPPSVSRQCARRSPQLAQ